MNEKDIFIILVDNDKLKKADAIILLEGDGYARVDKAVELYHHGWAPKIVFSGDVLNLKGGSFPADYVLPVLINKGVPETDIIKELKSGNTREQATEVMNLAFANQWKRILLVASHYHQYRAYLTFLKAMKDLKMQIEIINTPAKNLDWYKEEGWGKRIDLLAEEFKKIEEYGNKFNHIASFMEAIEYQKWKEEQTS
jgi:uncharacterized SAM-binding protein YcdF (DUF218 family)